MARRHWVDTDIVSMFAHTNKGVEADYLLDDYLLSSRRQSIKTEKMQPFELTCKFACYILSRQIILVGSKRLETA
jgi:hypothetical protein